MASELYAAVAVATGTAVAGKLGTAHTTAQAHTAVQVAPWDSLRHPVLAYGSVFF